MYCFGKHLLAVTLASTRTITPCYCWTTANCLNGSASNLKFFFHFTRFRIAVKNLVGGRTYYFRVLASSLKSYESSDEVKFPVPARVKHKAITAGVVGGILFFIVAIILSVCAVKICNKRKRRKQQKGMCEQLTHLFIASKKVVSPPWMLTNVLAAH